MKTHANLYQQLEEEEEEQAQLSLGVLLFLFVGVTIVVSILSEYLVDSIEGIVKSVGLSKTFIGLILLPIIGNAAEVTTRKLFFFFLKILRDSNFIQFSTAINAAMRNKMDFAIRIAAGSSMVSIL